MSHWGLRRSVNLLALTVATAKEWESSVFTLTKKSQKGGPWMRRYFARLQPGRPSDRIVPGYLKYEIAAIAFNRCGCGRRHAPPPIAARGRNAVPVADGGMALVWAPSSGWCALRDDDVGNAMTIIQAFRRGAPSTTYFEHQQTLSFP